MPPPLGLLNLDKPAGMSSRSAVDAVQRVVGPARVGHAGTLDPIATGVLVVCVGAATRLISFVQEARKGYRATFRFGVTSITDDIEGLVKELPEAPRLAIDDIRGCLTEFIGTIEQTPPVFSAVHVGGRRAYELARRGEAVSLNPRTVEVHRFEACAFDDDNQELTTEIECGSGTYVRSLGRDLARRLGSAAIMTDLRRTAIGSFRVEKAIPVADLTAESVHDVLQPAGTAVAELPRIVGDEKAIQDLRHGRAIPRPDDHALQPGEGVAVFCQRDELAAVTHYDPRDATLRPKIVLPANGA